MIATSRLKTLKAFTIREPGSPSRLGAAAAGSDSAKVRRTVDTKRRDLRIGKNPPCYQVGRDCPNLAGESFQIRDSAAAGKWARALQFTRGGKGGRKGRSGGEAEGRQTDTGRASDA